MTDGDRYVRCGQGHTHWGAYGAAGLLVLCDGHVLLQHRAAATPGGGTWGVFGGARHAAESPVEGALREASEESTLDTAAVTVFGSVREDHDGWTYDTVFATAPELFEVEPDSWESAGAAWVPVEEVADRPLFPPFAGSWPSLVPCLRKPVLVVDVANVMGSRADGWWRDRAGAAVRLRDEIGAVEGLRGFGPFTVAYPERVLVVEGRARGIGGGGTHLTVVDAPGEGDDQIVATVAATIAADPHALCVVVTADRELVARCEAEGAEVLGPRWLLRQTSPDRDGGDGRTHRRGPRDRTGP